ncbi:MAG: Rossmann-like and DUF2520 domain-containing protein, partial [Saprospiraceae bacterium]
SRSFAKAQALAEVVYSEATDSLYDIEPNSDLYIIAVKDDAIEEVAQQLVAAGLTDELVVHTSGATPSHVLGNYFSRYGCFYPLQSFSISRKTNFKNVPLCVYANNEYDGQALLELGKQISDKVNFINDEQRASLHVAAVFVNNFTNYFYQIAEQLLAQQDVPFALLRPLILETARKVQMHSPAKMQTGPAIRNDHQTIERHLLYLQSQPEMAKLYEHLTQRIMSDMVKS